MTREYDHRPPAPAQINFRAQEETLNSLPLAERFTHIYRHNVWGSSDSISGPGSDLAQTAIVRAELPRLLRELNAQSMLDIPCGDFGWMSQVNLGIRHYIGADIVTELVERNRSHYATAATEQCQREFLQLDLIQDDLPQVDLVFCRDCLVHLSFANIFRAFASLRRSGSRYLLTTTFTAQSENADIIDGDWRVLNLERPPFNLPSPVAVIVEGCTEQDGAFADKSLALWPVAELPAER